MYPRRVFLDAGRGAVHLSRVLHAFGAKIRLSACLCRMCIINEDEAKVVRDILHLRAQKQGIYAIAKYLVDNNIPSPSGGQWNTRSVRIIIERAADMYRGIAYAYRYEYSKEYRNGKLTTVKRVRPESEARPLCDSPRST